MASTKEIWSWYAYDWANSVYSAIVITFFAPVLLNTLAKKHASSDYDTCEEGDIWDDDQDSFNFTARVANCTLSCLTCKRGDGIQLWNCETGNLEDVPSQTVNFMGFQVSPFSFTTTVISISVFFQALLFIIAGPCADHGNLRKRMFIGSVLVGTIATMALVFVSDPELYWFAGILVIVSNCFFGLSVVSYNAYLPLLADAHPKVRALNVLDSLKEMKVRESIENEISTKGFMSGYAGSVILLIICIAIAFTMTDDGTVTERVCILIAGVWWLAFSIIPMIYLEPRPGPELEDGDTALTQGTTKWFTKGCISIYEALRSARSFHNTLAFLAIYFVYSDGYGTIGSVGVLFATENMCMSSTGMGLLVFLITVMALIGSQIALTIQTRYEIEPKTMVIASLSIYAFLPFYGLLGFATPDGGLGLKNEWEMYVFGFVYGSQLGAVQSYTRTLFSDLTPPGREAEFFSLFEITDKGSSWLGPLIVGILQSSTGEIRYSFLYIAVVMLLPIAGLILFVDHKEGMKAVGRLHDEMNDGDEGDEKIFGTKKGESEVEMI